MGSNLICHVDGAEGRVLRKKFGAKREEAIGSLKDLIVDGRIILTSILRKLDRRESTEFFFLVENLSRWGDLGNRVLEPRVPLNARNIVHFGVFIFSTCVMGM